jgi:hypothetical protein
MTRTKSRTAIKLDFSIADSVQVFLQDEHRTIASDVVPAKFLILYFLYDGPSRIKAFLSHDAELKET